VTIDAGPEFGKSSYDRTTRILVGSELPDEEGGKTTIVLLDYQLK
jgi:hypothetical protein